MCGSEPVLQGLEIHGGQRGTGAAFDSGEGLQHLGWEGKGEDMSPTEESWEGKMKAETKSGGETNDLKVCV